MIDPEYEDAYKMAGVTLIIRSIDLLTKQIIVELENPKVKEVAVIGGGKAQIYNIVIPPEANVSDKPIREIVSMEDFPNECAFMGIYRADEDEFIITRGSHVLHPGDNVFIISKSQYIKKASEILTSRA
jgi:trk system potassium uptake protein TrkA